MAKLKGIVVTPNGDEHALDTLEEAVRFIVILSDGKLTKEDHGEIVDRIKKKPTLTYEFGGFIAKADISTKRRGVRVVVSTEGSREEPIIYDSIKEAAANENLTELRVRSLVNSRFGKAGDGRIFRKGW